MTALEGAWTDEAREDIRPEVIYWAGPQGWSVRLDEDGISLLPSSTPLEQSDLERLLRVLSAADDAQRARRVNTPQPPTREQIAAASRDSQVRYAFAEGLRAARERLGFDAEVPL